MLCSIAVQAQTLQWALEKYHAIDSMISQNPNKKLSEKDTTEINDAIRVLAANGHPYEQASLLFYKANNAESLYNYPVMFNNLEQARIILEQFNNETYKKRRDLRLGNIWSSYSFYYDKFKFDFDKTADALYQSEKYYTAAGELGRLVEVQCNAAFNFCRYGYGGQGLSSVKASEKAYYHLTPEQRADIDVRAGSLDFLYGFAYLNMLDSLSFSGEIDLARALIDSAINRLERIHVGERIDESRMVMAFFNKATAYLASNTPYALDSAEVNLKKAIKYFANFPGPNSPLGLGEIMLGYTLYKKGNEVLRDSLITRGLANLGYPTNGIYDTESKPVTKGFALIQGINAKINLLELAYRTETDNSIKIKIFSQMLHDTEVFSNIIESFKIDNYSRQSLERLSHKISFYYSLGVMAAARLYELTRDESLKQRAFNLSESGRAFVLRYKVLRANTSGTNSPNLTNSEIENKIFPLEKVQKSVLTDHTAAITYSMAANGLTAIVTTRDSVFFEILPPLLKWKKELTNVLQYFEEGDSRYDTASERLYKIILAPILKKLSPEIQHLIIIPDDLLWSVNFDALMINKGKKHEHRYLIQKYAISYSYGLQITTWLSDIYTKPNPELSLGAYVGEYTDSSKMFTVLNEQVTQLYASWSGQKKAFNPASKALFVENAPRHNLSILALHGEANDKMAPEEYYLVFGDSPSERLKVTEIYDLPYKGSTLAVFMAACLTAKGKNIRGEGITSMARAFHYAGVPTLIAAGTKIPEQVTAEISGSFFKEIQVPDTYLAKALQAAKIAYLNKNKTAKPKLWAPLVCIGYGGLSL